MTREQKIWGSAWHLFHSEQAAVSLLEMKQGYCCSRHYHKDRTNLFALLSGCVLIQRWVDDKLQEVKLLPGEIDIIPSGVLHRFVVCKSGEMIEVYWPDHGGLVMLDDIVRLDVGRKLEAGDIERESVGGME